MDQVGTRQAEIDQGPAIEATPPVRLAEAIHGPERFIALIGEHVGDIIAAVVTALEPAVGFVHLRNLPASPLTLERILSEIGGRPAASPEHELASAADSLARRAGTRRRIVLILDKAQNLSMEVLLFLQALPRSTQRDRPVLKILFVADARFWALIGSDMFTGIRERSAEPIILDDRIVPHRVRQIRPAPTASQQEFTAPEPQFEAEPAAEASPASTRSRWRPAGAVAGLLGTGALISLLVFYSDSGTASGKVDARSLVAPASPAIEPPANASETTIEVVPATTGQFPAAPENPAAPAAGRQNELRQNELRQDELRQKFDVFLAGRNLTHLSSAQRDRLFRQYLASRGKGPAVNQAEAGR